MAAQVAKVKARARPWRSIIALALALVSLAAAVTGRRYAHIDLDTARALQSSGAIDLDTARALQWSGAVAFFLFGTAAAFGLSGQVRNLIQPHVGAAHAGVTRYALALAGIFTVLVVALDLGSVPVGQLVLGGAVTGVLIGIAAQQSLANLFAGMVLLFARPFRVGDRVRFRAGALGGILEGIVTDISITYVRLDTADGTVFVPNSQALAATVGPLPPPGQSPPAQAPPAQSQPAQSPPAQSPPAQTPPAQPDQAAGPMLAPAPGAPSPPPPSAPGRS